MDNIKVKAVIDLKGNYTLEVIGAKGSSCKSITEALEKSLGRTTSEELKPEYYVKPAVSSLKNKGF